MKTNQVFKHIKLILWGIAVAFIAQIFFTASISAQAAEDVDSEELSLSEKIERLSETLVVVGAAISESTNITDEERLGLLTQLVDLSRAITALERANALEKAGAGPKVGEFLPSNIDLHRVVIRLDYGSYDAEITEYYLDEDDDIERDPFGVEYDRTVRNLTLDKPTRTMSFPKQMDAVEDQVIALLMSEYGITDSIALDRIMYVTARNPRRDSGVIVQNSADANDLLRDFSQHSIIESVHVNVGVGNTVIEVYSDQDERIVITIQDETYDYRSYEDFYVPDGKPYRYSYEFYAGTINDSFLIEEAGETQKPLVAQGEDDLTEEQLIDFINFLFGEVPFTKKLEKADEKTIDFLMDNPVVYQANRYVMSPQIYECVDEGDKIVMDEYVLQLLSGLDTNYIIDELEIRYPVSIEHVDYMSVPDFKCDNVKRFY